ncbi:MAG: glycoside hydrolase family 3 protein, partial [Chloroflexota bacterium]
MRWQKQLGIICILIFAISCSQNDIPATPTQTPQPTATQTLPPTAVPTTEPTSAGPTATPEPSFGQFPYQNRSLPTAERVEDLLSRMSLDEKIGQMTLVEKDSIQPDGVARLGIGAILSGGGGGPVDNSAEGWLEMVTDYQVAALETDLQIPLLYGVDAVHGHSNVTDATIFPHNIGLGAARNPELVHDIARATALETLATGIHWNYAPVLAVPRDIRWGRTYEGFSENTDLVTELATAHLIGLQGVDGESDLGHPETLLGTPKHFIGDGGTEWGSSTTDNFKIDQGVTAIDEETLRSIHLPPYPAAIEAGAMSMMASYSSWGGIKMHGQKYLMTNVLRDELGFEGFIVSDWKAIDQVDPDYYTAVVTSINAGIDLNMVPYDYNAFIRTMKTAVNNGDISKERIDEAVGRILYAKFELGLFEQPFGDEALLQTVGSSEHRDLGRQAVRESLVLLQNKNDALPLSAETSRIFVSGIGADDLGLQSGGWTLEWQGFNGKKT